MYFYVVTTDKTKKNPFGLYGPYSSSLEAQREADKLEVESEVVESEYSTVGQATREIKAELAERHPERFSEVTGRMRHK